MRWGLYLPYHNDYDLEYEYEHLEEAISYLARCSGVWYLAPLGAEKPVIRFKVNCFMGLVTFHEVSGS